MNTSIHKLFSCECRYENVFKVCDAKEHEIFCMILLTLFAFIYLYTFHKSWLD